MLNQTQLLALEEKAHELRHMIVDTVFHAGSGHLGGALSMIDVVTYLYYHRMRFDVTKPDWPDRDRFIMSKGHAGIGFVCVLADLGFIPREELKSFNLTGSRLGIHLDSNKVPGVDASTGSLGHGSSMALGMALAAKLKRQSYQTYLLLGDGECNEGAVWEAAMATGQFQANNLLTMVDRNFAMIDGPTEDVMGLEPLADKWRAFGLDTREIDGHDFVAIDEAIDYALAQDHPCCIILDTSKGRGVSFADGDYRWHYGAINQEMVEVAHSDLDRYYNERLAKVKGA